MVEYKSIEQFVQGKKAIITGGTSGIGKACVQVFCAAGVDVVTIGRRTELGEQVAREINEKGKGQCTFFTCDVRNEQNIADTVAFAAEKFGQIDMLVNVAGYYPKQTRIDEYSLDDFRDILTTNLISYMAFCKYAMPYLRRTHGSIVNVGSVHGTTSVQGAAGYDATKGAIDAITRTLAIDEAQYGVRVNDIKPGLIETELYTENIQRQPKPVEFVEWNKTLQWLGRGGKPEEVAYAALFLASGWASFITGTELMITGGWEIGEGPKVPNPYINWSEGKIK